jgi:hypothetical protein
LAKEGDNEQTKDSQGGQSMALPHDKRQTEEQTTSFAVMAAQRHELPRSRNNACQVMMGWLLPRTGKP